MKAHEAQPGQHIRWTVSDYTHEGWVIGEHEHSGLIRVSAEPNSNVAHWVLSKGQTVEIIEAERMT